MSEVVVNDSPTLGQAADTNGLLLDGDAPRLAAAPTLATPHAQRTPSQAPITMTLPDGVPSLPATAPTLPAASPVQAPTLPQASPVLTSPDMPLLPGPTTVAARSAPPGVDDTPDASHQPAHPMAHLMPSKAMPNEASRRAAAQRAARKAKAKKIKIGVAAGMLVFTAVVGPPVGKWVVDAVNEAGDTSTVDAPVD